MSRIGEILSKQMTRREWLKVFGIGSLGSFLAACQPNVIPGIVDKTSETVVYKATETRNVPNIVEPSLTVVPTEVPPVLETGSFTREQLKHQIEINQEIWDFWSTGKVVNEKGEEGTLFDKTTTQRTEIAISDPTAPNDPSKAIMMLKVTDFQGGELFTLPSRFVNQLPKIEVNELKQKLTAQLEDNAGLIPEGFGPLILTDISSNSGVPVRRDEKTNLITQVINDKGEWAETMKPAFGVERVGKVGNIEVPVGFGIMKGLTERKLQPVNLMEANPDRSDRWEDELANNFMKLCFENHISNYPDDKDMTYDDYLKEVEVGKGFIKLNVADGTTTFSNDIGVQELQIIEYSPKNGVLGVADATVKGFDQDIMMAYASITPEGRLFITHNQFRDYVDFEKFYKGLNMPHEKSLAYYYLAVLAQVLTGVIDTDPMLVAKRGGYVGEVIYANKSSEVLSVQRAIENSGVNKIDYNVSEPMVILSGPWVK